MQRLTKIKLALVAICLSSLSINSGLAQDHLTIVLYGTSLTASGKWAGTLSRRLENCSRPVKVVNRAKSNTGSDWGLEHLGVVLRERPNVVVVEFSINDARELKGVSLAQAETNTREMIERLRAELPAVRIFLMITNPVVGIKKEEGRPNLAAYFDVYRKIAEEGAVGLIEPTGWKEIGPDEIPDGVHPLAEAHRKVTVPAIVKALENAAICVRANKSNRPLRTRTGARRKRLVISKVRAEGDRSRAGRQKHSSPI